MNFGTHSTIEFLAMRLLNRWVPKWYEAFADAKSGGFYERLGLHFKPVQTGSRRLLTQCRQLAIYSHASMQSGVEIPGLDLLRHFNHILDHYLVPSTGGWRFSVDDDGRPLDHHYDLYALSFVIFSFSHYFRATGDARARDHALATLRFIDTHFRLPGLPGLAEGLDVALKPLPKIRRQNPHMHLLEACLFARETWPWDDAIFTAMAREMVSLFDTAFYSPANTMLGEFFTDDLKPHPDNGHHVEPGHYFEWIWLLKKFGAGHNGVCAALLGWANRHGWDNLHGGIYDVLDPSGAIVTDTKRLWPFTEAIKANALMLDTAPDKSAIKARIAEMVNVFRSRYMQERGFWVEWLSRDLKPQTDYMPGTTPYHVYFGIMETRSILNRRGSSMSLVARPIALYYRGRRGLSAQMRRIRRRLKSV